ncbi:hypothetical protein PP938_gp026 [Rhizobium phage AF3]|uniref:Uncharacterized protein n=1 Tax=Rhizobium phage AF3 TaxID=2763529 RepID=A0A7G7WWF1_9CAUD|nr:hypothetical protein PP938_gp026 [Rhizobium phage AF3]QNH71545.1 hypothetical protein AF3_026 [Rhizobium phage AF3]
MTVYRVDVLQKEGRPYTQYFFGSLDDVWTSIETTWKELPHHERPVLRRHAKDSLHYWICDELGEKFADVIRICGDFSLPDTNLKGV